MEFFLNTCSIKFFWKSKLKFSDVMPKRAKMPYQIHKIKFYGKNLYLFLFLKFNDMMLIAWN